MVKGSLKEGWRVEQLNNGGPRGREPKCLTPTGVTAYLDRGQGVQGPTQTGVNLLY